MSNPDTEKMTTVAILYPGEMGASVAALLLRESNPGVGVVTTLAGRGERTRERCRAAGITVLDSLEELVEQSNIVISLVAPTAADEMVDAYCALAARAPANAIYVDANSISPDLAVSLAKRVERTGRSFVDAAINGLAKNLVSGGTLYLSGARAGDVAKLFNASMRVRVLGAEPGLASTIKTLLSGLSKGVCALYAELGLLAQERGVLGEFMESCALIYPGISALIDRMLPTYAQHAGRRAFEMNELEATMRASDLEPAVIAGVRQLHYGMARVSSYESIANEASGPASVAALIHLLAEERALELIKTKSTGKEHLVV